jgi:hypothetical protein
MLQEKLEPIIYGQPAMITTRASFRELPSCFSLDPLDGHKAFYPEPARNDTWPPVTEQSEHFNFIDASFYKKPIVIGNTGDQQA